jgi:hypothetical protein
MQHFARIIMDKQENPALREDAFSECEIYETEQEGTVFEFPIPRSLNEQESHRFAEKLANYFFAEGYDDFDIEISADDIELTDEITLENDEDFYEEFGILGYVPDDPLWEAEYDGKKVKLNQPMRGDVKKFKVYVNSGDKTADGKVKAKKVNFGSDKMEIKRDDPEARRSFRARHNCDNPGPNDKARYWSCKMWQSGKTVSDMLD